MPYGQLLSYPIAPSNSSLQPQQEPTRAAFATHPAIAARCRPSVLALPLAHEPVPYAKQRSFLGRLLQQRGGDSAAGKADLKAPLAEAVATGILTLAIGLMSATSSGLSGACDSVGCDSSRGPQMVVLSAAAPNDLTYRT